MAAKKGNTHGFQKGRSYNPGGRPKNDPDVMRIFKASCQEAAEVLVGLMKDKKSDPFLRKQIAEYMINRVYGRPRESVEVKGAIASMVFAMPAKIEDPDIWEAQAQKVLGGEVEH